jgi:sec-independent protein translocase protein TatA
MDLGAPELLVILLIVIVLFGTSRVATLGKDLGTAMREFRRGFKDDPQPAPAAAAATASSPSTDFSPSPTVSDSSNPDEQKTI